MADGAATVDADTGIPELGSDVRGLEAALSQDSAAKLSALQSIASLIDPKDESYNVQKVLSLSGVFKPLVQLLEDDDADVSAAAATTLRAICSHSEAALSRTRSDHFTQVDDVNLNPVQDDIALVDGVIVALVNMVFSGSSAREEAAQDALTALCSYNRANGLNYVREVVRRLLQGEPKAMDKLDDMLGGFEVRDDAAILLDQTILPVLKIARTGFEHDKLPAVNLLGTIIEKRRGAASFLVAEGAVPTVLALLVTGDLPTKDAAARTAWLLLRGDRALLAPESGALGVDPKQLAQGLAEVVRGGVPAGVARSSETSEPSGHTVCDNSDDALLLLKALALADASVRDTVKGMDLTGSTCAMM